MVCRRLLLVLVLFAALGRCEEKETTTGQPVFLRICMGDDVPEPAGIHLFGRYAKPWNDQHYVPHANVTREGLFMGANTGLSKATLLGPGDCSPWVDLDELLPPERTTSLSLDAIVRYREYLPRVTFTVELARSPEGPVVASFTRAGTGSGVVVRLDRTALADAMSNIDGCLRVREQVRQLPKPNGRRPTRFPILTGLQVNEHKAPEVVVESNLEVLATLGFSGISAPGVSAERLSRHGFTAYSVKGYLQSSWCRERCWLEPTWRDFESGLGRFADRMNELGMPEAHRAAFWSLGDEYSSRRLSRMQKESLYHPHFRQYLQQAGYTPQDFGEDTWQAINIVTEEEREQKPLLYLESCRFRPTVFAAHMRHGTKVVSEQLPGVPTTTNFAESLTYHNNLLYRGVDWFHIMKHGDLSLGWTETWLPYSETSQLATYHFAMMSAACRDPQLPWGVYSIVPAGQPWDAATKAFSAVGHGARVLSFYNYGPEHNGSHDTWSDAPRFFGSIQRTIHTIGTHEEPLLAATPVAPRTAIYYSHVSDVWHLHESSNLYGAERKSLQLLLQHVGLNGDMVTADQVRAGQLANYDLLCLVDAHVEPDAMAEISRWVRAGGTLYASANSATLDHLNRPADGLSPLGIARAEAITAGGRPWRALLSYHGMKPAAQAAYRTHTLEAHHLAQHLAQPIEGAAQPLLTSAEEKPLAVSVTAGMGVVHYVGALPGLSYRKPAAVERRAAQKAEKESGQKVERRSINGTAFDPGWRTFMEELLQTTRDRQPVRVDDPYVEARLLQSPDGLLVVLANWAGEPREVNLTIRYPQGATEARHLAVQVQEGEILWLPKR